MFADYKVWETEYQVLLFTTASLAARNLGKTCHTASLLGLEKHINMCYEPS